MVRKKDAKALFEVIKPGDGKSARPLGVPGWFGQAKPVPAGSPAVAAPPAAVPPPAAVAAERPAPASGQAGASAAVVPRRGSQSRLVGFGAPTPAPAALAGARLISTAGGRVRISLNHVSATVAAIGLIVLLAGAFALGRWHGRRLVGAPAGDGSHQDVLPVVDDAPAPGGNGPSQQPSPGAGDLQREKGFNYLVIQTMVATAQEADHMRRFLAANGVNATVQKAARGYTVKDTRPFKDVRAKELGEYLDRIEELGREYRRQGGRYDFRQDRNRPYLELEK